MQLGHSNCRTTQSRFNLAPSDLAFSKPDASDFQSGLTSIHSSVTAALFFFALLLPAASSLSADDLKPKEKQFFETKIRPVLVKHCYNCHSSKSGKTKGGFALDSRESLRAGGDSGHGVVPGDLDASLIVSAMKYESFEMPPKKQLPAKVIKDFERWVKMGAPDPRNGKSIVKNKSSIDFDTGRKFWAFQKPKKPSPPNVSDASWPISDLDHFVLSRIENKKLQPVKPASESELLRRDFINLIGLPPTERQIDDYVSGTSPNKRERLIDQLLDSPQFGERWGRHWLDIARFAESNGRERNFLFPHAWRYRDYVIDSFNADKPYDRFITEQLAGDLIEPNSGQPKNEPKVGTGFLAVGPKQLNEGNREVFAMDLIDEQIDVVSRSTMALTVSCARCHDHKFDPVSTEDYYALAGIFRSTETLFGRGGNGSRQATALMNVGDNPELDKKAAKDHASKISDLATKTKSLDKQVKAKQKQVNQNKSNPEKFKVLTAELAKIRRRQTVTRQQLKQLRQSGPDGGEVAMGAKDGKCVNCNVLIRGEVKGKGPIVERGFLTVLSSGSRDQVSDLTKSGRLELANWITSPENPLTARVAVNRIWLHLFGAGIVRTVDNFGESGERPTHPELLDYLANRLIDNGWSFKKTIREVMLSKTYQMSSTFNSTNYQVDPDNRLLWRMNSRRIDAEVMRDAMRWAAGDLNLERPEASIVAKYKETQGVGRGVTEATFDIEFPHRSVYLPVVRNAVPEPLRVFDFAEPSILVGDRQVTTVPTQALFMMNSKFVIDSSKIFARRLDVPGKTTADQIRSAYKVVYSRPPSQDELTRAIQFVEKTAQKIAEQKIEAEEVNQLAMAAFCQALFASSEFRFLN